MTESYRTRAARLAAAAQALQAASGPLGRIAPFSLAFLTDGRRIAHPELVARVLPAGAAIVFRDYDDPRRAALGARLRSIAAARGLRFLVGGDPALARRLGADGVHLRSIDFSGRAGRAAPDNKGFLVSAACHSRDELLRARDAGAHVVFLSPVLATKSHAGAPALGADLFRRLAEASPLPVLALGGVNERNARLLAGRNVCGLGAIGALVPV